MIALFLLVDKYTVLDTADNVCENLSARVVAKLTNYVGDEVCSNKEVLGRIKAQMKLIDTSTWQEGKSWSMKYMPFLKDVSYSIKDILPSNDVFVVPYGYSVVAKPAFEYDSETFSKCRTVILSESLQVIEDNAFMLASAETVELSSSIRFLGDSSFADNAHLKHIRLNKGLCYIGRDAFKCCLGLTEIEIPSTVAFLPFLFLSEAVNIQRLVLNEGLLMFNMANLWDLEHLTELVIPDSVLCLITSLEEKRRKLEGLDLHRTWLRTLTIPLHLFTQASKRRFIIPDTLETLIIKDDGSYIEDKPYKIFCSAAPKLSKIVLPEGMQVELQYLNHKIPRVEMQRVSINYATDWGNFEYRLVCSNSENLFYAVYWHDIFLCCVREQLATHQLTAFLWETHIQFQALGDFEKCLKNFQLFC